MIHGAEVNSSRAINSVWLVYVEKIVLNKCFIARRTLSGTVNFTQLVLTFGKNNTDQTI